MSMTKEEHRQRHIELHASLDELFADYITNHPNQQGFVEMPFKLLLDWSCKQTFEPDHQELRNV